MAGHADAPHTAGRARDAAGAALAASIRRDDSAGAHILPRLPSRPGRARRAAVGDHPAGRAAFLHHAAGFTAEHRRHAQRWDLAAIARDLNGTVALYVGGSDQDPYEHRQIQATRERVPGAEILAFPGGHLTTSEHPDLLAAAIRNIAERHGVGTPAAEAQHCTGRDPGLQPRR